MAKKYPEPWKRGTVYYFTILKDGKRCNISTRCAKKEDARVEVRKYVDARATGTAETFRAYSAPYFIWDSCPRVARRLEEGKSMGKTHVKQSRALLERWVLTDPVFPDLPLREITRGQILDLRKRLRARVEGINTVNKAIACVKTILSEAAFRGEIPADPGARVGNINYEQRERGVLEAAEVREILAARPGDMGKNPLADVAITLLFCSGCRVGELRALRWGAVALDTGRTRIEIAFKGQKEIGTTKWDKPRAIVLPRLALDRLRSWREKSPHTGSEDFILATVDGAPVGITWVKDTFNRVLDAAEVDEDLEFKRGDRWLTPHAARHTLNTALLAAGVSPLLVQTFLGWSSAEGRILGRVQQMYSHLELLRLEDVAEKIEQLYAPRKTGGQKRVKGYLTGTGTPG
ncbi:MAG: site-specific integrase [Armatimonadetes bacterium]|nr:site-specific integrase [Armatimonadota bacterium]